MATEACPDPSAHGKSTKLSEQASTAALYVTHPERANEPAQPARESPLGADGKLSSKSAAASLKYAKAQDLPSFPSHGGLQDSAGKAAMLAKDYKMKELWQPEQSIAGSKAAILAQAKGGKLDLWQASASADGHSAATLAMRNKGLSPVAYGGVDAAEKSKALRAATMSASLGRQRAGSTPVPDVPAYPDAQNSGTNALNAATASHRTSTPRGTSSDGWDSEAMQAARIKNVGTNMDREMFSERPPVELEREEAKHQAALRASAVSMAKQIYDTQNRSVMAADPADVAGAQAAAGRSSTSTQPDIKEEAMRYIHLQEAAHKLAAERLAKVDKSLENSRFREYYGYDDKPKRLSSRMSLRSVGGRQHKRATSDGSRDLDADSDDEEQARRIRSQMSQLHTGLSQVDQKKQQDDRAKLLAAAEKRVSERMHTMDEKVFAETGKVPPALMEEWEAKARERAQKEREEQAQHPGKTHVGGGKFMDQSEIEAIAAARLKPTLDEINDTAEKRRARDEEVRLEKEENERQKREEKAKNKEDKDEQKRIKNEEKVAAKREKEEEKARKTEEKRLAKEEKRKSRDIKKEETAAVATGAALAEVADNVREPGAQEDDQAAQGLQRHRSALSKLKERFRRSHVPDEASAKRTESVASRDAETAAVTGAATGAAVAEGAELSHNAAPQPQDAQQAEHAIAHEDQDVDPSPVSPVDAADDVPAPVAPDVDDEEETGTLGAVSSAAVIGAPGTVEETDDKWKPVEAPGVALVTPAVVTATPQVQIEDEGADADDEDAEPTLKVERPPFEQKPSLSGFTNDDNPATPLDVIRPDLERHISRIPESDDDDDDEDWNDEKPKNVSAAAAKVEEGPSQPPADQISDEPPFAIGELASRLDNQRAQAPAPKLENVVASDVPTNIPAVKDDNETKLETDPDQKDHTILRQILNPGGDKFSEQAFGTTAHETPVEKDNTEEKPSQLSQAENSAATATDAGPSAVNASKASADEAATPETKTSLDEEPHKERAGIRGLFSKLGNRKSKSENKYPEFKSAKLGKKSVSTIDDENDAATADASGAKHDSASTATPAAAATVLPAVETGPSLTERIGTEGQVDGRGRTSGVGGNPEPASPSSYQRGEADPNDPDDVSSSGVDEEDLSRGRGGRIRRRLGFGRSSGNGEDKSKNKTGTTQDSSSTAAAPTVTLSLPPLSFAEQSNSTTEEEQFEEARDHFDETLAPAPAFAGQAKSGSPVRGTRFQEQL